jgi:choline dehydrogenase-like flavoprotein
MSASPRLGVVDKHCQVHGMRNLHVAGSSVFCTAGANYPTVNLVALAVRLADRLAERGSSTQSVQTVQALAA